MGRRVRLAYVVTGFPTFSETFIQREVAELLRRGVDLDIYSLRPRDAAANVNVSSAPWEGRCFYAPVDRVTEPALTVLRRFGFRPLVLLFRILRLIGHTPRPAIKTLAYYPRVLWLVDQIQQKGYDQIHAHWATQPATAAYVIHELLGIPFGITAHAYDLHASDEGDLLVEKLRSATHVATCTRYNLEYLRRLAPEAATRFHLVYHGLDPHEYDASVPHRQRGYILAGGRLVEKKGFDLLLRALGEVKRRRGREIPAVLFGDGPQREHLLELQRALGLQHLEFAGRQPHERVKELMAGARVLVAPSVPTSGGDIDGIPNVILEAFATATPVIGSRLSGIPEVVLPGQSGWLVEPGDVDGLAGRLIEAWDHPELCARLGEEARRLVHRDFGLERNTARMLELFDRRLVGTPGHEDARAREGQVASGGR